MAVVDIDGDPIKNVIGGIRDWKVDFSNLLANMKLSGGYELPKTGGATGGYHPVGDFTSPEQGRDYDAADISHRDTINPDTPANTGKKVIPWGLIVVGGFVLYILFRGK